METIRGSIKRARLGKHGREAVRSAVRAIHVLELAPGGKWEVRTLGERGRAELFDLKDAAIQRAFSVGEGSEVVVHQRDPKKVVLIRPPRTAGGRVFREVEMR